VNDNEINMAAKCVAALENIAASLAIIANIAALNPPEASEPAKRGRGRPRKVVEMTPEQLDAAVTKAVEAAPPAPTAPPPGPTEEQRKEAFGKLRKALQDCLALHGEEVTRERLKFAKFSEVPFEAINDTITRLAA
jgi:AT hook motif